MMLGHLSEQRNTPERAAGTVSAVLDGAGHGDVTLLSYEEIDERRFASWRMGRVNLNRVNQGTILRFSETSTLDPFSMQGETALALLQEGTPRATRDTVERALDYINRSLDKRGVTAFDRKDSTQRNAAVSRAIELSLGLLEGQDRVRLGELAIFPEDTRIPLALAFIDTDRRITEIHQLTPDMGERRVVSAKPARFALETNPGWFEANQVSVGDRVEFHLPDDLLIE